MAAHLSPAAGGPPFCPGPRASLFLDPTRQGEGSGPLACFTNCCGISWPHLTGHTLGLLCTPYPHVASVSLWTVGTVPTLSFFWLQTRLVRDLFPYLLALTLTLVSPSDVLRWCFFAVPPSQQGDPSSRKGVPFLCWPGLCCDSLSPLTPSL